MFVHVNPYHRRRRRHRHRRVDVHRRGEVMACVMIHVTMQRVITTMVIVLLHHLLKKVMEVRVLQVVNALRVHVVVPIVVVVKEDLVDALIVIMMVNVPVVVLIITDLTLSVTPAVVVKQVLQVRHHLLHVSLLVDVHRRGEAMATVILRVTMKHVIMTMEIVKKILVLNACQIFNVHPVNVQDPTVAIRKDHLLDVLIVIQTAIVPVAAPIITKLVFNVLHAVTVKQVHRDRHRLLPVLSY